MKKFLRRLQGRTFPAHRSMLLWLVVAAIAIVFFNLPEIEAAISSGLQEKESPPPSVSMIMPGGEAMKYWSRWRGPSP